MLKVSNSNYTICLLALYRPPSSNCSGFLEELRENLGELSNEAHLYLVGDINIDTLKTSKNYACDYLSLLAEHGIIPTVQSATREEVLNENLVSSCLDHINVRAPDASIHSAVILQKLADHYFVACKSVFPSTKGYNFESACRLERVDFTTFD